MVHFNLAGCVSNDEYTICERLLDILMVSLPDITISKYPVVSKLWPKYLSDCKQKWGSIESEANHSKGKIVTNYVMIWTDTGRILAMNAKIFSEFIFENYNLKLDLTENQLKRYTAENIRLLNTNVQDQTTD